MVAESFERIHRSNLVGMGILPLQFTDGATTETLGLTGVCTLYTVNVLHFAVCNFLLSSTLLCVKHFLVTGRLDSMCTAPFHSCMYNYRERVLFGKSATSVETRSTTDSEGM